MAEKIFNVLFYKYHIFKEDELLKNECRDVVNIIELSNISSIRDDIKNHTPLVVILEYSFTLINKGYYIRLIKNLGKELVLIVTLPDFLSREKLQELCSGGQISFFINSSATTLEYRLLIQSILERRSLLLDLDEARRRYDSIIDEYNNYRHILTEKDQEISKLKKYIDEIIIEDETTGLSNERYFISFSKTVLEECRRYKDNACLAIIEIDNIPQIVEVYGESCSGAIYKETGEVIKKHIRKNDIAAFSDDHLHFLVCYKKINFDAVRMVTERLRIFLNDHVFIYNEKQLRITVSIGMASSLNYYKNAFDYEELAAQAKIALTNAIKKGRNSVVAYA
ncbi:MAG: hypothetical protein A2096_06485 [Spirochaetes bacterium GWF1_41_5]|nr:MAG: hypothetical protein A2096_06485 [Spirochaetes bacterium GWF1_41_5]HBE04399.1 hypothetical protein [Spirochaetia bacterium]